MSSKTGLTPEEEKTLQEQLPKVLEQHGANNKSKSKYVKSISEFVIGSKNPKFFSMQPRVKDYNQLEQWKAAYLIVFNFLDEFKCDLTKEVMMKELEQNKVKKPPLPSIPNGYGANDVNEIFCFETLFEVANNDNFEERVENFVVNYLHEDPEKQAAKPLNQSPGNSPNAFLTQPNTQHAQNNVPDKADDDVKDDEVIDIDDFNDDYDKEDDNQAKTEEKGSKQDDEEQEVIDINDITDSEGEADDKKESHGDDMNIEVDDFNDDEDFVEDDDDKEVNENNDKPDTKENKSESDAQNSNMSISINSDMFEVDFDDS